MVASGIVYVQLFPAVKVECSAVSQEIEMVYVGCCLTAVNGIIP